MSILKSATPPVTDRLILICEKCGKKLVPNPTDAAGAPLANPAQVLQNALKVEIKKRGLHEKTRALLTSCMNICPTGEITVAFADPSANGAGTRFYTRPVGALPDAVDEILKLELPV